jgi:hypothetical protein
MVTSSGAAKAAPSLLDVTGTAFTITWNGY